MERSDNSLDRILLPNMKQMQIECRKDENSQIEIELINK